MTAQNSPVIHRFQATLFPVNAYLVEGHNAVVAIDSTLGVSDGRALRAQADALGKPLLAVIVTHAHPDHYGAIAPFLDGTTVPVLATEGVNRITRRDDEHKEAILRPMFGAEWAEERTFPTRTVKEGEHVRFGDLTLRVMDLGPGESPHDSAWVVESDASSSPTVFCGDLVVNHMHCFLADGYYNEWLANIARARRELPPDAALYMGHGNPGAAAPLLDWTEGYIRAFAEAVKAGPLTASDEVFTASVERAMKAYLPSEDLAFLMQLSIAPLRESIRAKSASLA